MITISVNQRSPIFLTVFVISESGQTANSTVNFTPEGLYMCKVDVFYCFSPQFFQILNAQLLKELVLFE